MITQLQSLKPSRAFSSKILLTLGFWACLRIVLGAPPASQTFNFKKRIIPLFKWMSSLVFVLFSCAVSWAQTFPAVGSYGYNSSITLTLPSRTTITVDNIRVWGGGGGGGTGTNSQGGGGGGGYASRVNSPITVANTTFAPVSITVTVGTGGPAGSAGGASTITFAGVTLTGNGGAAGTNSGGAGGTGVGGAYQEQGGNGGNRNNDDGGGGGGGSGVGSGNGSNGGNPNGGAGGPGGTSPGGDGGEGGNDGGTSPGRDGKNGAAAGGGGGGKGVNAGATSGAGAAGRIQFDIEGILPVELTSFTAMMNEKAVEINWATANELNNEKFIVETSQIGEVFNPIGEVRGAGTTFEPQKYRFTHHTPSEGTNYYRLKQVDFDGTFAYSKVVAVNAPGSDDIFAFPNPTKDKITVQYDQSKGSANVSLFDALGRRLNANIAGYAGNYEIQLPLGLPKGTYWLKVERGGKVQTLPVIKE